MLTNCTCCDLPPYSCGNATPEQRAKAAAETLQDPNFRPPRPTPKRERVVPSTILTTASKRAWAPIPRNRDFPALCVNPKCRRPKDDGAPNPRETGGRSNLCLVCEDRARDDLNAVADAWPDLEEALTNPSMSHGEDPVHGTPVPGIVLDEAVQAAMTAVEETLAFYGRLVREERGAVFPLGEPSVPELARWLGRTHLPWLAAHPDPDVSGSLVGDARDARRVTHRHAYGTRPRKISLPFRCRDEVPVDAAVQDGPTRSCDALMHTTLHPDADVMPDLVCEVGHVVPPSVWMRGTWRNAPIDPSALTSLVRSITTHTAHTSETAHGQHGGAGGLVLQCPVGRASAPPMILEQPVGSSHAPDMKAAADRTAAKAHGTEREQGLAYVREEC